jgi:hypothetical protein
MSQGIRSEEIPDSFSHGISTHFWRESSLSRRAEIRKHPDLKSRKMSAAGREAIAEAQRECWAIIKKGKK